MRKLKKNKGITLIALVITIIILIILAGISISIVFGQDGLIQKAKGGANSYTEKASEEFVALKIQEWKMENAGTGISLFDYFAKKALTGEVEIDESVQQTDENNIGIVKNGYISIIDKNGNIIETQKIGPRPTIDTSSIKVTLQDGTEIANNSQEVGTPLKIAFSTTMENGTITKVEPLTATVTTENGVTKVEYVTNGTDKQISFRIYGKVAEQEYTLTKTISVADKYENVMQAESLLKAISDNEFGNNTYAKVQVNGTNGAEVYNLHVYNVGTTTLSTNTTYGNANDVGTESSFAKNMVVLKVNGDLTINQDVTVGPFYNEYGGPKGFMIYVTGTLTNNGTIDNSHGAYAEGQDVYLWKNSDASYEFVSKDGADGGERTATSKARGKNGKDGKNRYTGGGGSGGSEGGNFGAIGQKGTSYSGGTGGGAGSKAGSGYAGATNGGAGGNGNGWGGGGAGNPGGQKGSAKGTQPGSNGTGGLLIIFANLLANNGNILSYGSSGGAGSDSGAACGGGSGGGSINIFTTGSQQNQNYGTVSADGGSGLTYNYGGGTGGTGSIAEGQIINGQYVDNYHNWSD